MERDAAARVKRRPPALPTDIAKPVTKGKRKRAAEERARALEKRQIDYLIKSGLTGDLDVALACLGDWDPDHPLDDPNIDLVDGV